MSEEPTFDIRHTFLLNESEFLSLPSYIRIKMLRNQLEIYNPCSSSDSSLLLVWCKENCKSFMYHSNNVYHFEDETEAMAFKVRWAG